MKSRLAMAPATILVAVIATSSGPDRITNPDGLPIKCHRVAVSPKWTPRVGGGPERRGPVTGRLRSGRIPEDAEPLPTDDRSCGIGVGRNPRDEVARAKAGLLPLGDRFDHRRGRNGIPRLEGSVDLELRIWRQRFP